MESNGKKLTAQEAAAIFEDTYVKSEAVLTDAQKFKYGADWQKEQDKALVNQLQGIQAWIADPEMKKVFTDVLNELNS